MFNRSKKKTKEGVGLGIERGSTDEAVPAPPLTKSRTFRLGRKTTQEPVQKPELDVANALPKSDDFRTSLLMSGLSARFSMLREQDDPKSLMGKASDDSVLFPKRQSRLVDFGFMASSLADISEVSSLHSSAQNKQFAMLERMNSYSSLEGIHGANDNPGGSVMARAKPAHGNNLFGGRQKVFKLSNAVSTKDLTEIGSMGGRAVYDDDVSMSAFQKLREFERQKQRDDANLDSDQEQKERSPRPRRSTSPVSFAYSRSNRETSSTTASGQFLTRSSTAATSVTSRHTPSVYGQSNSGTPAHPALERNNTKARRLYETGLDQHLHNQQHSAMSRLDSLSRKKDLAARTPSPGIPSPTHATFDIPEDAAISGNTTPMYSPDLARLGSFEHGNKRIEPSGGPKASGFSLTSPPLSPPMSEPDEIILPIRPEDRGKATASGAFAKPAQPYDEKKYTLRQLQLQQGRSTPNFHDPSSSIQATQSRKVVHDRPESQSDHSVRSTSSSSAHDLPMHGSSCVTTNDKAVDGTDFDTSRRGTFFNSVEPESDDGTAKVLRRDIKPAQLRVQGVSGLPAVHVIRPPEADHPALRGQDPQQRLETNDDITEDGLLKSISVPIMPIGNATDSPTLGLTTGLSGMVRQHLRNDSNSSSMYAPSPGLDRTFEKHQRIESNAPYSIAGNPWTTSELDSALPPKFDFSPLDTCDRVAESSSQDQELQASRDVSHRRHASTETQKERAEFHNELAERRRRVQENLRSYADPDSRPSTPVIGSSRDSNLTHEDSTNTLRQMTSRTSLASKTSESSSKAMRMLGLSGSSGSRPAQFGSSIGGASIPVHEVQALEEARSSLRKATNDNKVTRQARRETVKNRSGDDLRRQGPPESAEAHPRPRYGVQEHRGPPASRGQYVPPYANPDPRVMQGSASYIRAREGERRRVPQQHADARHHQPSSPDWQFGPDGSRQRLPRYGTSPESSPENGSRPKSSPRQRRNGLPGENHGARGPRHVTSEDGRPRRSDAHPARSPEGIEGVAKSSGPGKDPFAKIRPEPAHSRSAPSIIAVSYASTAPSQSNNGLPNRESHDNSITSQSPIGSTSSMTSMTGASFGGQDFVHTAARKRTVNKADISDPTFISTTARVPTIELAEANPTANVGISVPSAPQVPELNPKRRPNAPRMFDAFKKDRGGDKESLPRPSRPIVMTDNFDAILANEEGGNTRQLVMRTDNKGVGLHSTASTDKPEGYETGMF